MAWSDVLVHDCGPMGNDCHLDSGAMAEGPLTTATPKVCSGALGLSVPRFFVLDLFGCITGRGRARKSVARAGHAFLPQTSLRFQCNSEMEHIFPFYIMAGNWRLLRSQDQAFQHHAKMMDACEPNLDDGLSVSGRFIILSRKGSGEGGRRKEKRKKQEGWMLWYKDMAKRHHLANVGLTPQSGAEQ
jgi:hypothetical protein